MRSASCQGIVKSRQTWSGRARAPGALAGLAVQVASRSSEPQTPRRALCTQVAGAAEPELWRQLPPPFAELWLRWAAEGGGGGAADRAAADEAARLAFARSLLGQPGGDAGSGRDAAAAGAGSAEGAAGAGGGSSAPAAALATADAGAQPAARASLTHEQEQARGALVFEPGAHGRIRHAPCPLNLGRALRHRRAVPPSARPWNSGHTWCGLRRRLCEAAQEGARAHERLPSRRASLNLDKIRTWCGLCRRSRAGAQEGVRVRERLRAWRASPEGAAWQAKRAALPVVAIRDDLLAALAACDVAVVGGDTGCGKTTQARGPPCPRGGARRAAGASAPLSSAGVICRRSHSCTAAVFQIVSCGTRG